MNIGTEYLTTCFIDQFNDISGRLYFSDDWYIDFDERVVCKNGEYTKIPDNGSYELLVYFVLNMNRRVSTDKIIDFYYGDDDDIPNYNPLQKFNNFKTRMKNKLPIEKWPTGANAYYFNCNYKIKKFNNICKEDVKSINTLFSQEKISKRSAEENKFIYKFLNSYARILINKSSDEILKEMKNISNIFNSISRLEAIDEYNNNIFLAFEDVVVDLYGIITNSCRNEKNKNILKIKGPLGSYKTRILEYIFLMIKKQDKDILPFYINVSQYEKTRENNSINEKDFIETITEDFKTIEKIVESNKNRIPLILLDGVRDFSSGKNDLYLSISKLIDRLNFKIVVSLDTDFTMNYQHKFKLHPLAPNTFSYFLRITSMKLYNKDASVDFIRNCIDIFDIEVDPGISPEKIYDSLVKINLISLDAYWLINLLRLMLNNIIGGEYNISDLYYALCLDFLGSEELIDSASDLAYEFEYGSINFNNSDFFFDVRWRLIRKHRSVLEYLIARKYIRELSKLDFVKKTREEIVDDLKFFNMVLQKTITRFVVTMLNGVDDYEHKVMIIANQYYDELSLFGKSELTFWMGRLKNTMRKRASVKLLHAYQKKERELYERDDFESLEEKRNTAFILRGISVSLIYENDKESLKYYLNSLLTDKIANSVNRGFHLEYYGDKPYIPNKALLDFEDDVRKGENTLNVLCLSLDKRIKQKDTNSCVALVEVITICNLLQARIECDFSHFKQYIEKCKVYLKWIRNNKSLDEMPKVKSYFEWMSDELSHLSTEFDYNDFNKAETFNKFNQSSSVNRTGWVENNIPNPENIVEHMYKCWLIGLLYLPDDYNDSEYDKEKILQMLLIHDLGETITGDINRPDKLKNQLYYDAVENKVMQSLLFTGTYPDSPNLNNYLDFWNAWDNKRGINYEVAKDIDNIQTIYQYCDYYLLHKDLFSDEDIDYWLSGIYELNTDIGKKISETIIENNPKYSEIIKKYNSLYNI